MECFCVIWSSESTPNVVELPNFTVSGKYFSSVSKVMDEYIKLKIKIFLLLFSWYTVKIILCLKKHSIAVQGNFHTFFVAFGISFLPRLAVPTIHVFINFSFSARRSEVKTLSAVML